MTQDDGSEALEVVEQARGVLFDADGTLVDTTFIHTLCWWQAFRQADLDVAMAPIHRSIGMGADQLVSHVLDDDVEVDLDALSASHDALYSAYWPRLRALPGARELVSRCHETGLVTVLASSAAERELGVLLKVLDIGRAIDHTTSADDVERSKPHPDIVAAALQKASLQPDQSVYIGDAVWDVQASSQAGLVCIGLESGGTGAAELREAGALEVYRDPAALLADFASSRLGQGLGQRRPDDESLESVGRKAL